MAAGRTADRSAFDRAAVEQALAVEAAPLVVLSSLAYLRLSGLETWTPGFVGEVHKSLKEKDVGRERTRELLAPHVRGGKEKIHDRHLNILEDLLDHLQQPGLAFESAMDKNLVEVNGLESFVVASRKVVTVVFCGSNDPLDWKVNLQIEQHPLDLDSLRCPDLRSIGEPEEGIAVHAGFWEQYGSARATLVDWVAEALKCRPGAEVHVTGHSLGAALAVLCGWDLARRVRNQVLVLNFACPRVGNRAFARSCAAQENLRIIRVKVDHDPVTTVPFWSYEHAGDLAWIRGGGVRVCQAESWEELAAAIPILLRCCCISMNFVNVLDHMPHVYIEAVLSQWPLGKAMLPEPVDGKEPPQRRVLSIMRAAMEAAAPPAST